MKRRILILAALLCLPFAPAIVEARDSAIPAPRLSTVLRALGDDFSVPAAWTGIWEDSDSTFIGCGIESLIETSTDRDTLCLGETLAPEEPEVTYICTGTVTDTQVDMTCNASFVQEGCTISNTFEIHGTRTGNTSVVVVTLQTSFSPPSACFEQPDQCTRIVTRSTRLGPAPEGCGTPVENTSWGSIKSRYR